MQELFHGLIRSRCREGGIKFPETLPVLSGRASSMSNPEWFPVDGMYGGFAYWFEDTPGMSALMCESWCRMDETSFSRHRITVAEVTLLGKNPA